MSKTHAKNSSVLFCLLWLSCAAASETQPVTPANFTHLAPISINSEHPVAVTAVLPPWVYLASQQHLADLRVFNADDISVAHHLRPAQQAPQNVEITAPAIAVPSEQSIPGNGKAVTDVQLDAQGNLHIQLEKAPANTHSSKIAQWVFQANPLTTLPVNALRFAITGTDNFSASVDIEYSDDLRIWRPAASQQKILALGNNQEHLEQLKIAMSPTSAHYWRIRSTHDDLSRINKIWLSTRASQIPQTETLSIACQLSPDQQRAYCLLPGVQLPLISAQFNFAQQPIAFNAQVKSYTELTFPSDSSKKAFATQSLSSTFTQDASATIQLNGSPIGYLELNMQNGGPLGLSAAPSVNVQWPAQQLTFLAHGQAPFTIAVGASGLKQNVEQVINSTLPIAHATIEAANVQISHGIDLPKGKKPWLLCGLLSAAVIALSSMAFKLLRGE